jgi:hypothetical protein
MTETPETFLDADIRLRKDDPKSVTRKITQEIPDSFLRGIRDKKFSSSNSRMGDMHHVASIPVALAEKWIAEGFNIFDKNVSVPEILKRLHSEDMTAFIATNRRIG